MTEWKVRRASSSDAESFAAIGAFLFRQAYGLTHPEPTLSTYLASAFDPSQCALMLRDPHVTVLAAEAARGEWIGYVQLREGEPDRSVRLELPLRGARPLEIVRFYVDQRWHGRGVAQSLMAACEQEARSRSCDVLWLQAWQQAPQALAFYRKSGFRVIGTAIFHFGDRRDDDFLLARSLSG